MKYVFHKYFIVLLCAFCLVVPASANITCAADNSGIGAQPLNLYVSSTSENVSISDGIATCSSSIRATTNVTEVIIVAKLQKYQNDSWVTQETFTETSYTYYGALSRTCAVDHGYSYRLVTTYQAVINGVSVETVNKTYNYGLYM
ncbi:hypothetical protein [Ruminiclostridium papyrosolvens]|uniref:Uncharacterized protein n=1 Tax=Ruminiclostridium papyrosolvens C7 TaxID=1330534 RepID=U4QYV6_9FIRM|nr:hypothetical protein [Ruminiclostridium papyrosolvens]EPR10019.1 hypothetical protein L323_15230 [Ruminiclostridium papyrosolvens C7]